MAAPVAGRRAQAKGGGTKPTDRATKMQAWGDPGARLAKRPASGSRPVAEPDTARLNAHERLSGRSHAAAPAGEVAGLVELLARPVLAIGIQPCQLGHSPCVEPP
jgi:hypothetical protein